MNLILFGHVCFYALQSCANFEDFKNAIRFLKLF